MLEFLSTVRDYGPDRRYRARAGLYLFKLLAFEPFRRMEQALEHVRREGTEARTLTRSPLFVLGYYRSGTTHLQETFLQDPQFGYMNFFQCIFPSAFALTEPWVKPVFERIVRKAGMLHPAHQIPFSFELPAEEDVSMLASGFRLAANWGQTYPRHFKRIYSTTGLLRDISPREREELKAHLHDLFWRVSRANGGKRLVLKSPPQLGRVSLLTEMFPDAKYVFIRRNPYDVFASNKKLWKSFEKTQLQEVDPDTVREYILWSYTECHRAYERDRHLFRPGQLCEIAYEDFRAAPLETLRHVYETLDLGDFTALEPTFATFLDRAHKWSQPPYRFSEVELREIATRLEPWIARWGYAAPSEQGQG